MSVGATVGSNVLVREDPERGHRTRVMLAWLLALAIVLVIAGYGLNYYTLSAADRPFSPKHDALRPSGPIGIKLGMFGVFLFFLIYLYPLRKKWGWLARQGNSRHWLDFHVVLGTLAPIIIAFHATFKFGNIAGMAFWSMLAVTLSGFVGRYLYAQIPRNLNAAELTMKEMTEIEDSMRRELAAQNLTFGKRIEKLYDLPTPQDVEHMPMLLALLYMILIDLRRPFRLSILRLQSAGFSAWMSSLFGFLRTSDAKLEHVIGVAQKQAKLSKRILFLSRTEQVFNLWHVVHRPFSYAFALLALIHICLALYMGYRI
jgi:TRAP-type C4-dicarboxylate transport system permease small subunit